MPSGVRRVSARVPEKAQEILWWEETLWRQARGREHLHHARKWARLAARRLWQAGRHQEAIRFVWARERAIIGLVHHGHEGRMSKEEKVAMAKAGAFYRDVELREFERLMIHYVNQDMPPRAWMFR